MLNRSKERLPFCSKARQVARGYCHDDGFTYEELFALVACFESVRILLAAAVFKGWDADHEDVIRAFLNSFYDRWKKYGSGQLPSQNNHRVPEEVEKLLKSMYGLW